jgi:hypothetical protein
MDIPDGQLEQIRAQITAMLDTCMADGEASDDGDLPQLREAFEQLVEVMTRLDADAGSGQANSADVTEIGEYALRLTENLGARMASLQPAHQRGETSALVVNLALWVAGHGGQLDTLEPVVDALARHANAIREPRQLEALCAVFRQIIAAVAPLIREDLEKFNPGRPWRVLLLNQSIVATRSHNTALMEQAFSLLTQHLPDDAPRFFSEGMQQMDALDYPEHVRKVMQKYHRQWNANRSLH